jgi:AraC family transcriptional regulator of arabinose operon
MDLCFSDIFAGMHWLDAEVRINSAGAVLCEPGWSWDSKSLPDYDLWFIFSGRGTIAWEGQPAEVSPGSCFCLRPGSQYHARHDPEHRLGVCYVHFEFADRIDAPPPHAVRLGEVDLHERVLKHVVALQMGGGRTARQSAALHLRGVLGDIAVAAEQPSLSGVQREHHDAIWASARYIRENPGELFSIEHLAERAHYSADHFARLFRQIVGQTPKEFCIRTRLQRAQSLLAESSLSVEQIAAALGYADVFFFSRQFKQRTGKSPTQWRRAR